MKKNLLSSTFLALAILGLASPAPAQVPSILNYQGRVTVGGTNLTTNALFKFALVDGSGSSVYWKNDGALTTNEPSTAVTTAVAQGLYSTLLGDTALSNMAAISPAVFTNSDVNLRVWFSADGTNFVLLTPDQRIASSGYALRAAAADLADTAVVAAGVESPGSIELLGALATNISAGGTNAGVNLLAGYDQNSVFNGAVGVTVLGGGTVNGTPAFNAAAADFATIGGGMGNNVAPDGIGAVIGGGYGNMAGTNFSTVAGGQLNTAGGFSSSIGGGQLNTANGLYSAVGGGYYNTAGEFGATIGGGHSNAASGMYATVAGGVLNTASTFGATIGGGHSNTVDGNYATIAGGYLNTAHDSNSVVAGGSRNTAAGNYGAIAGGYSNALVGGGGNAIGGGRFNSAGGGDTVIAGGLQNSAAGAVSAIGGGYLNTNGGMMAFLGGGWSNTIGPTGTNGVIGGGEGNKILTGYSAVVGGKRNQAEGEGDFVFIGGGSDHRAYQSYAVIAGGITNEAGGIASFVGGGSDNKATGQLSVVPGGYGNHATGYASVAAGWQARATNDNSFVLACGPNITSSTNTNSFTVRAPGGARFLSTTATNSFVGVILTNNATAWATLSDSNSKTDFRPIEPREILSKVAALPVTTWHYKHDRKRLYIGPMAQDFHAAFGLGSDDKTISTLDSDGVMYAAIQGLVAELEERDKVIEELKAALKAVNQRIDSLPPAP